MEVLLPNESRLCSINTLTSSGTRDREVEGISLSPYGPELQSCRKANGNNLIFTWYLLRTRVKKKKKAQWCVWFTLTVFQLNKNFFFSPSFATFSGSFLLSCSIWFWSPAIGSALISLGLNDPVLFLPSLQWAYFYLLLLSGS